MIIPAIDLIDGNIVRLYQGDYQQQTNFNLNPLTQLQSYQEQGAKWLHLVDLTGAKDPTKCQTELLCYLATNLSVNIQVGGGIRTKEQITKLLTSGINRVVIGSLAVKSPELVATWLTEFGSQAICLALDVNINKQNEKIVAISGWQQGGGKSLESIVNHFTPYGLQHALVTDISRDGTMQGANTQLYTELALEYPQINWQASGGIASLDDIYAVKQSKANAIIIGKALLTNQFSVSDAITAWHKS